jgi:hypothetical protein
LYKFRSNANLYLNFKIYWGRLFGGAGMGAAPNWRMLCWRPPNGGVDVPADAYLRATDGDALISNKYSM